MTNRDDMEIALARLGEATKGIVAPADFPARVMEAIDAESYPSWLSAMGRAGQRILPIAALAAAVALTWAAGGESAFDEALAASYDAAGEIQW